ncbi:MerR family transcriptional regulator [Streptomonospora litoralis]|uniref:DNA-binding transcriptional regulator CueR n=1 Tax=Streptomonospora litoralis TaxID=2498135 RepID=A0A4P6Q597_9ACTN|nr:MerR family transcriptional regulator [Streptomonospora litoralis]QBI55783.1 DNA-binding transcriptional regulator CueR [Streptomonospora litoralis]
MADPGGSADGLGMSAVSAATGYSRQQIRDLEALGVIPAAHRAPNGYRRFSPTHVRDLRAYRDLATAVGPVEARRTMALIRTAAPDEAAAAVASLHARLNREREEALAAQRALRAVRAEAALDSPPAAGDAMTITELADALGVRTSTLRFWDKAGLVTPERVTAKAGSARRYPLQAIREARITAALRTAGYRVPDVRRAMAAVRDLHDVGRSLGALEARVDSIARRTLALLRAGTTLADIIAPEHRPGRTGDPAAGDAAPRRA